MTTNENLIPIPGRLHSVATEGHVAGADEIYDDTLQKDQATINSEVNAALGEGGTVDEKIEEAIDNALEDVAFIDDSESSPAVVPGFDPTTDTVHVTAQTLSETQKAQVRNNIGLGDVDAKINEAVASEASQRAAAVSGVQSSVNAEASRAQAAESALQNNIEALTQSNIVVVADHTSVSSPDPLTIYREQGTNTYSDWMYQNGSWNKMAEYDNAIDDVPTAGSDNLVKSGGIYSEISQLGQGVFINVNGINNTRIAYESKAVARAAVPLKYRSTCKIIAYRLADGWVLECWQWDAQPDEYWESDYLWKTILESANIVTLEQLESKVVGISPSSASKNVVNGLPWSSDPNYVYQDVFVPIAKGQSIEVYVNNAPSGWHFGFVFQEYDENHTNTAYTPADIDRPGHYVITKDATKYVKFGIGIFNDETGEQGIVRVSSTGSETAVVTTSNVTYKVTYPYTLDYIQHEIEKLDADKSSHDDLRNAVSYIGGDGVHTGAHNIQNGKPWDGSDSEYVYENYFIPIKKGEAIEIFVDKEFPGYHLGFVYQEYRTNAWNAGIAYTQNPTSSRYIITKSNAAYIRYGICLIDNITGEIGTLRISDTGNPDGVLTSNDVFYKITIDYTNEYLQKEIDNAIGEKNDAYLRIADKESLLLNACNYRASSDTSKLYQALFISDPHADTVAIENSVKIANGFSSIEALICLGDIVQDHYGQGYLSIYNNLISKCNKPVFNVPGNHDAGETDYVGMAATHQQIYDALIKPMIDNGYLSEGEYTTNKNWWYHDIDSNKIRLIAIYEYDEPLELDTTYWNTIAYNSELPDIALSTAYTTGQQVKVPNYTDYAFECVQNVTTPSSTYDVSHKLPSYKIVRGRKVIMQTQAQWFLDTLCSTPADYSVVVLAHACLTTNEVAKSQLKFCQPVNYADTLSLMQSEFIGDAIKAFKDGTNFTMNVVMKDSAAYLNTESGGTYAYSVSKDFSQKNSGVKFLCAVSGHQHMDVIYKDSTRGIYDIKPTTANSVNYAQMKLSDIKRTSNDGYSKDSLTAISFNPSSDAVSLVKLGVNVTVGMTYRDFELVELI